MKTVIVSISSVLLLLQIMSFANSEKRLDIVFHHYLNPFHLLFAQDLLKCCCKSSMCFIDNNNITCDSQCDTYFSVCFKKNTNSSRVCYNTTKPTDDNTTLIPFTTPNIVQFMINSENMTLENALLTIEVTNKDSFRLFKLIDFYSIDINQRSLKRAIYIGSKGNSQIDISIIMLSFSCNYYATNCTERDNEYGHYICDHYGNKICRNGYTNSEDNCTQKIAPCKCTSSLVTTTSTSSSISNFALSLSHHKPSATFTLSNISPSIDYQVDDDFWKPIAMVSLTLSVLLVLSWIILIIGLCSCKLKMKGKEDRVDVGSSSGINDVTYEQPISTKAVYIPSTIEDKPVDTYDILFDPPSMSTVNADYSTLFDDKIYVSNDDQ